MEHHLLEGWRGGVIEPWGGGLDAAEAIDQSVASDDGGLTGDTLGLEDQVLLVFGFQGGEGVVPEPATGAEHAVELLALVRCGV